MAAYHQFCPVAQALDLLGERWTLLVMRELLMGSTRFSDLLKGVPRMPRSTLSKRLETLELAGVIRRVDEGDGRGHGYEPTEAGEALRPIIVALGVWGRTHVEGGIKDDQLDAGLLMWDMQRRVRPEAFPEGRTIVRFDFVDGEKGYRRFWIRLEDGEADLCLTHPGFDEDLVVSTDVRTLTEVWAGKRSFHQALRTKVIRAEGRRGLARRMPSWFELSVFASEDPSSVA